MTDTTVTVVEDVVHVATAGAQGPAGTLALAALADWDPAVNYRPGVPVLRGGRIYVAAAPNLGEDPDLSGGVWLLVDVETVEDAQARASAAQTAATAHTDTVMAAHTGAASGVHGVGGSTVESTAGAQAKADAALAAAEAYAASLALGLPVKYSAAAAAAVPLSGLGLPLIGGYQTVDGDMVLATAQSDPTNNGLWVVHAGVSSPWTRPTDSPNGTNIAGAFVVVDDPNNPAGWILQGHGPILVGTGQQTWSKFTSTTDAAVAAEAAARTAADLLLIPLSQKGAPGGVVAISGDGDIDLPGFVHPLAGPVVDPLHSAFDLHAGQPSTLLQRFNDADAYAFIAGLPVYLPGGHYVVHYVDAGANNRQFIQDAVLWFSDSPGTCIVEFPDSPAYPTEAWCRNGQVPTTIRNITVRGPTTNLEPAFTIVDRGVYSGAATYNRGDKVSYVVPGATAASFFDCTVDGTTGIPPTDATRWISDRGYQPGKTVAYGTPDLNLHQGITRTVGDADSLLDHVVVDGWFGNAVSDGDGTCTTTLQSCRIQSWKQVLSAGQSTGKVHRLHVYDSVIDTDPALWNSLNHLCYINPNVSKDIQRNTFKNRKGGWALHLHGTTTESPLYEKIIGNIFESSCEKGMLTERAVSCEFKDNKVYVTVQALSIACGIDAQGNEFWASVGLGGTPNIAKPVLRFKKNTLKGVASYSFGAGSAWNSATVVFDGETCDVAHISSATPLFSFTGPDCSYYLQNIVVPQSATVGRGIVFKAGKVDMQNCAFAGTYLGGVMFVREPLTAVAQFDAVDCDFSDAAGSFYVTPIPAAADTVGKVRYDNCRFGQAIPTSTIAGGVQVMPRRGKPKVTKAPGTIAAGSKILTIPSGVAKPTWVRDRVDVPSAGGTTGVPADLISAVASYQSPTQVTLDDAAVNSLVTATLTLTKTVAGVVVNAGIGTVVLPGNVAAPNDIGATITLAGIADGGGDFVTVISGVDAANQIELADNPPNGSEGTTLTWSRSATDAAVNSGSRDVFSSVIGWDPADVGAAATMTGAGVAGGVLAGTIQSVDTVNLTGHFSVAASTTVLLSPSVTFGPVIVSAATIVLSSNHDTYVIAAGAVNQIDTIQMGGSAASQRCFIGNICLIPPGPVSFGAGGNIRPRTGLAGIAREANVPLWFSCDEDGLFKELNGRPALHASSHAPGGSDALDYGLVNLVGTLAARPVASAANAGLYYFATDDNGGTVYRSNGAAWVKAAKGVTEPPGSAEMLLFSAPGVLAAGPGDPFEMQVPGQVLGLSLTIRVAPVGGPVTVDLMLNGATMFTTSANRPTIPAGANASLTIAVPNIVTYAARAQLRLDLVSVGTTTPGTDLTATLRCKET